MKHILPAIFATVMLTVFSNCKKHDSHQPSNIQHLQGVWELRHLSISWQPDSTLAAGNGRHLTFTGTNWTSNVYGQAGGKYTIDESPVLPVNVCSEEYTGGYHSEINFINGMDTVGKYMRRSDDTLTLRRGCFAVDGGMLEQYVRIAD